MSQPVPRIEFTKFLAAYKPIINPNPEVSILEDEEGKGIGFETYGIDFETVSKADPACVFTACESEIDDGIVMLKGFRFVNRIYYIITSIPCDLEDLEVYFDD